MYLPKHFEETRPEVLHALVRVHPLATWVLQHEGSLLANHVPFLLDTTRGEHGTLVGHVARANPVWQAVEAAGAAAPESLLIFQGADAYISPSWYPSKREHGKVVPTWNYAVVHAHGGARTVQDAQGVLAIVSRLTQLHESPRAAPWAVADAPPDYIDQMLRAIVGIEIPITRIVGKWKVSQNRSLADRQGVAGGLLATGAGGAAPVAELAEMAAMVQPSAPG